MKTAFTGFQKSQQARLRLEKKAAVKKAEAPASLNPDFPYAVESFDPGYWRIQADLTPVEKKPE